MIHLYFYNAALNAAKILLHDLTIRKFDVLCPINEKLNALNSFHSINAFSFKFIVFTNKRSDIIKELKVNFSHSIQRILSLGYKRISLN